MAKLKIDVNDLHKNYGKNEVLKGITTKFYEGDVVCIIGPSGSGKTTLLNVISSIDSISGGTVEISGNEINQLSNKKLAQFRKKELGFIFQDYSVLPTLTVKENIMLPLSVQKMKKDEMEKNYQDVTEALDIYDLSDKYPSEISGGQQQRTAAARAFVHQPSIIFADEPTGALDSKSAQDLLHRLEDMNKQFNSTIIMVTHDPSAASFAQRVIMLKDGDIHSDIHQQSKTKSKFYNEIIQLQSALGGVANDV